MSHDRDGCMPSLPQELVDAILANVDDTESLKACSLVESRFRVPSQQILLEHITLSAWTENYGAARILLEESPHVTTYVTNLELRLCGPRLDSNGSADNLPWVLRQLVNVRQFAFGGHRRRLHWDHMPSGLAEALLQFISRQHLLRLHVSFVTNFPGKILLKAASHLSFFAVELPKGVPDPPVDNISSTVQELVLRSGCDGIHILVAYPYFRPYISTLRRVSFSPRDGRIEAIVVPAADTLEQIHLDCNDRNALTVLSSLPSLPILRTLEFKISTCCVGSLALILDIVSAVVNTHASHVLAEVVLTFSSCEKELPAAKGSMMVLDEALVAHPAAPCIRWRMYFPNGETYPAQFGDLLKLSLPKAHELSRLVVEGYRTTRGEWYSRQI
ncbi:hypothetical protein C8R45DRAFT_1040415 [Mycena sanguinolenta]|nr:hypothetical protein C8R45DRAFT_1040415 [Mycena sanguinolenta]